MGKAEDKKSNPVNLGSENFFSRFNMHLTRLIGLATLTERLFMTAIALKMYDDINTFRPKKIISTIGTCQ